MRRKLHITPGSRRDNVFGVVQPLSNGDQKREAPLADEEDMDDLLSSSTDQDMFQCDGISDDEPLTPTGEHMPCSSWPDIPDHLSTSETLDFDALQLPSPGSKTDSITRDGGIQKQIKQSLPDCSPSCIDNGPWKEKTVHVDNSSNTKTCTPHGQSYNSNLIGDNTYVNIDFSWPWYILFIVCCEFWGNVSYMDPIWFVCYVSSMCFVSFVIRSLFLASRDK